jgi:hypothetical protein
MRINILKAAEQSAACLYFLLNGKLGLLEYGRTYFFTLFYPSLLIGVMEEEIKVLYAHIEKHIK